ncbi:MAG: hypothetical protein V3U16_07225 [Candidatus Neomarinimicrobiota bacterium]
MKQFSLRILISVLALSFGEIQGQSSDDACFQCHLEIDEDMDVSVMENINNDVHILKGLGCADCHGGDPQAFDDPDVSMWDSEDFIGSMDKLEQVQVCRKCHSDPTYMRQFTVSMKTDQVAQFWTSQHGTLLKSGDNNVASCSSCHGVHGIYPVSDPRSTVYPLNIPETCAGCHSDNDYMAEYDVKTDQFEKYRNSVHGTALYESGDISAPVCNDCHGNHGAVPPEIEYLSDICGTCHINNMNLFRDSNLSRIFTETGLPQCETCHGNHEILKPIDQMLDLSNQPNCESACHVDTGDIGVILSKEIFQVIDSLKVTMIHAQGRVDVADQKGMEVSELFIHMEDALKTLIQTRTSIHSFDIDHIKSVAQEGFEATTLAIAGAEEAINEHGFRRKGLFLFSLIITVFVVVLYLRSRISS